MKNNILKFLLAISLIFNIHFLLPMLSVSMVLIGPSSTLYADGYDDDDYRGNYEEHEANEDISNILGTLALWGMLIFNGLYYYTMMFRLSPPALRKNNPLFKFGIRLKTHFRNFHYLGNPIIIIISYFHGITAEDSNFMVWIGWGLMVLLAITGTIMKLQRADAPGAKLNRLIHSQHILSIIMILSLLIGHSVLD